MEEVLVLGSINSTEGFTCSNGLLLESEKRTKIDVSFRQVSHFILNENGFSFFLAAFVSKNLKKEFSIDIKIIIIVKDVKKDKNGNVFYKMM